MHHDSPVNKQAYLTSFVYGLTAAICSLFMIARNSALDGQWLGVFLVWLIFCIVPLVFAFAYPRFLFDESPSRNRLRYCGTFHVIVVVICLFIFVSLSLFWRNPLRHFGDSMLYFFVPLSVLVIFLVSGVSLLLKKKSNLVTLASILFWPYWLALALAIVGYWYQGIGVDAACHFFCFITPVLLVFAAALFPIVLSLLMSPLLQVSREHLSCMRIL